MSWTSSGSARLIVWRSMLAGISSSCVSPAALALAGGSEVQDCHLAEQPARLHLAQNVLVGLGAGPDDDRAAFDQIKVVAWIALAEDEVAGTVMLVLKDGGHDSGFP